LPDIRSVRHGLNTNRKNRLSGKPDGLKKWSVFEKTLTQPKKKQSKESKQNSQNNYPVVNRLIRRIGRIITAQIAVIMRPIRRKLKINDKSLKQCCSQQDPNQ
jgi:hypothetical protein